MSQSLLVIPGALFLFSTPVALLTGFALGSFYLGAFLAFCCIAIGATLGHLSQS